MDQSTTVNNEQLQVNPNGIEFLRETSKWAFFLAIVGYVGVALMVLGSLFAFGVATIGSENTFGALGGGAFALIYLALAGLYFFPVHYLFRFSEGIKKAVNSGEEAAMESGLKYLKKHYKFLGIMMIVILSIYLLMFFSALSGWFGLLSI
ncbi:DUF5362 family protein [Robertkochia flava]|uniref:DUF5362 family protein n=1 Tax=Robertkochia flava TaxID=3447986 RepID=UPI001CCB8B5C|nr:DUF5362 family protein [Robertkochia marina]